MAAALQTVATGRVSFTGGSNRDILTPEAVAFVEGLASEFRAKRDELLAARSERQLRFDAGERPDFSEATKAIRESDLGLQVSQVVSIWGLASNPFDCWLAERGLATLSLRWRAACANAAALAEWLSGQPAVKNVVYPGRPDHPDHVLARRMCGGVYGNILCFELKDRAAVNRFLTSAPGIPFSPSLAHTTTTCSHPATTSHRYATPAELRRQEITEGLVRLSVGCEKLEDIKAELSKGLGA